nr:lac repressor [Candidatus Pantoea persica]
MIAVRSHNSAADTVNELLAQRVDALMINLPPAADEAE